MTLTFTPDAETTRRTASAVTGSRHLHVLIADTNPTSREAREQQLVAAGYRVSTARTAFEAIVKASCHMPDVILLDSALTDIDASETTELLATCPMTAHIRAVSLAPGRPVPRRIVTGLRRRAR